MKFISASIYSMALPFKRKFQHSLSARAFSDSFVLSLTTDTGITGYGEGVARPYVTGETPEESVKYIESTLLPFISSLDIPHYPSPADCLGALRQLSEALPAIGRDGIIAWNAAKCAVELAVVDCLLREHNLSLATLLPPQRAELKYSVVIGAFDERATRQAAEFCRDSGISQIKIKVGVGDDLARVRLVREIVGSHVSIRIDANGAFDFESALSVIDALADFGIAAIEQPLPRGDVLALAALTARSAMPVMVDESLITLEDANELIALRATSIFNLRLSKNGGIFSTLALAAKADSAGLGIQLGCQVGETAILSAAGRHVAACLPRLDFLEGSYGELLLEADLSLEPVAFSQGGRAKLLTGKGLGIEVCPKRLERYAREVRRIDF